MTDPTKIRRSARTGAPQPARRRPVKHRGTLDRMVAALPFSERTLARMMTGAVAIALGGLGWVSAQFFGLPAMAHAELAQMAANAGFQVKKVEVRGIERMDEMPVYSIALSEVDRSMLTLDLDRVRSDVRKLGWVADARVSRRLPDTLVVDIVERQPAAVWQHGGQLSLIDAGGHVLEAVDRRSVPDLPLVVGPMANRQTPALGRLLEAAPALKPMIAGATWIGNRRWDLRFQSGETLQLPEGEAAAASALVEFAQLDGVNRLLGRGIVRFDMRDPTKYVLRMPSDRPRSAEDGDADAGATAPAPDASDDKPEAQPQTRIASSTSQEG